MKQDMILVRLDRASSELMKADSAVAAKRVADVAKGLEIVAIRQKDETVMRYAHRVHANALRLEGEFLAVNKNEGGRPKKTGTPRKPVSENGSPTLKSQQINLKVFPITWTHDFPHPPAVLFNPN